MSAAFCYSHRDVTKLDLRHIYSGQPVKNYRTAPPVEHGGINYLDRIHDDMRRKRVSKLPGKIFEYNREYGAVIPRAPAFRQFSSDEVESVVDRLSKPGEYYLKKNRHVSFSAPPLRNNEPVPETPARTLKKRKPLTKDDINAMVNRLFASKSRSAHPRDRGDKMVVKVEVTPQQQTRFPDLTNKTKVESQKIK